ncbi:MAG TPA: N-6 DNA methylase [Polyangiaceae bacterium]|jgi:type I restriction enzyme M protein
MKTLSAAGIQSALAAVFAKTRGFLDSRDATHSAVGLLALRRASAGDELASIAAAHEVDGALRRYLSQVERGRPQLAESLSTLLAPARREPTALAPLLRAIADVPEVDGGDTLLAIMKLLAEQGKMSPAPVTGSNVLRLIARLSRASEGAKVCDPFCGAGLLLAAIAVLLPAGHIAAALHGWERSVDAVALARAVLAAVGADARIEVANALVSPPAADPYDAVVSAPPFGVQPPPQLHLGASERFRFGAPTRHADWLYAQHALSILAPGGTAVLVMSRGPLFREGAEQEVRRGLIESDLVDSIIALPSGALTGTAIPACLVVLRRDRPASRSGGVLFIDASARGPLGGDLTTDVVDAVERAYETGAESDGPTRARRVSVTEIAMADFSLEPGRHLPPEITGVERPLEEIVDELHVARQRREAASRRLKETFDHLLASQRVALGPDAPPRRT